MIDILGYISLGLMGLTLGLMGAGGSILTIPILVYLLKVPIAISTTYSLGIVGLTAGIGSLRFQNHISFYKAAYFALPSVIGVFIARSYILPYLYHSFDFITVEKTLLGLFVLFMALASYFMIKDKRLSFSPSNVLIQVKVIVPSFFLGIFMGLLGAGGGFLIIPFLVLMMHIPMFEAVPTSLFIITLNSFVGFLSDPHTFYMKDWKNILIYSSIALVGMVIGIRFSTSLSFHGLKKRFGWFILGIAILIAFREFCL